MAGLLSWRPLRQDLLGDRVRFFSTEIHVHYCSALFHNQRARLNSMNYVDKQASTHRVIHVEVTSNAVAFPAVPCRSARICCWHYAIGQVIRRHI